MLHCLNIAVAKKQGKVLIRDLPLFCGCKSPVEVVEYKVVPAKDSCNLLECNLAIIVGPWLKNLFVGNKLVLLLRQQ